MKYRTIVEIVCDSYSEEDAAHTAGEYLRGNVCCEGVKMVTYTRSIFEDRLFRYAGLFTLVVAVSLFVLKRAL